MEKDTETEHGFDEEHLIIRPPSSPALGKYPSIAGSIPSSFHKDSSTRPPPISPPVAPILITKDSCTKDIHCPSDKVCSGNACINPCVFQSLCGENQECLVIAHKAVCQCKLGYPIKINNNCYARDNFTSFSRCNPNPCGANSECTGTEHGIQCKCKPNTVGSPPECKLKCNENFECPELLACSQNMCQDPCQNACGKLARCRVYHQTAKCFCPRGFQGNPRVSCIPPKHYNSRLDAENGASLIEIFDKSDPGSSYAYSGQDDLGINSTYGSGTESIAGFDYNVETDLNDTLVQVDQNKPQEDLELEKIYDEYVLKITNNDFVLESTKGKNKDGPRSELAVPCSSGDDSCPQDEEATTLVPSEASDSSIVQIVEKEDSPVAKPIVKPLALLSKDFVSSVERSLEVDHHYDDYADDSSEMSWQARMLKTTN